MGTREAKRRGDRRLRIGWREGRTGLPYQLSSDSTGYQKKATDSESIIAHGLNSYINERKRKERRKEGERGLLQ